MSRLAPEAGLCEQCSWGRRLENRTGSAFWQCQRASEDRRYRRYPQLPVRECAGFEASNSSRPPASRKLS